MEVGDSRWHAQVLAGDDRAWRDGYDAAFDAVRQYVHWRCGGEHAFADDVVQETWLTAVRRIGNFRPNAGSFSAWVRGVAANVIRNQLRDRRRRRARTATLVVDRAVSSAMETPDDASDRIARAIAALPAHYESVLRAKYCDGLSVAAIAEQRSDSAKAVESLLTRARDAFRSEYEREARLDE